MVLLSTELGQKSPIEIELEAKNGLLSLSSELELFPILTFEPRPFPALKVDFLSPFQFSTLVIINYIPRINEYYSPGL